MPFVSGMFQRKKKKPEVWGSCVLGIPSDLFFSCSKMFTKRGETEGAGSVLRLLTTFFTHWRPAFEKVRPLVLLPVSAVLKQRFKAWHPYPLGSWAHQGDGESRGSASFRNVSFGSQQL